METVSKQEARDFKARWKVVNDFITDEIRQTPIQLQLEQLRTLFNSRRFFTEPASSKQVEDVRARWILLKAKLHA